MKKISLLFIAVSFSALSFSQIIANGSFENWSTRYNRPAPDGWVCDSASLANGTIKKVTGGSVGEFSIHLGTANVNGNVEGALITRTDSLTKTPGNLLFDYKVINNNTSGVNGLYIEIYFRDAKNKDLKDFNITMSNNQSSFANGKLPISFDPGQVPKYYTLILSYFNVGGLTNESTVIDNVRFEGASSVSPIQLFPSLKTYPNPANGLIHVENIPNHSVAYARLVSITGPISQLPVEESTIDVSQLNSGMYTLELFDANNQLIKREKMSVVN